jgi:carbon monoxide dehydrogenase subunit G
VSWWTTHCLRTVSDEVPAPPDEVRDFYVDLDNIKELHPLVVSVHVLAQSRTAVGFQQEYQVRDRIPFGPFAIRISYRARVDVPTGGAVTTEARQFPGVRLNGTVTFEPVGAGTLLTERLSIAAPRLLAAMTEREAVSAHVAMLAGIRRHFENRLSSR